MQCEHYLFHVLGVTFETRTKFIKPPYQYSAMSKRMTKPTCALVR